ncbi:hypothetical protein WM11_26680 [Burkholderia ubonensis]|nr:hypothetical protein WI86_00120 [Burkholderia ubonensis]KVO95968.1 hypothetical protein WJ83_25195 [Burkholderia ubonensis]KVT01334.1 hypothetical protein WK46_17855 [Burkholderia ubonensis]KVT15792.1 hypothetical protein WK47_30195 [Burkholderia ubonensis]KVT32011.1 hypothetical protein WK50_06700 [Burkholderia ubonensis]
MAVVIGLLRATELIAINPGRKPASVRGRRTTSAGYALASVLMSPANDSMARKAALLEMVATVTIADSATDFPVVFHLPWPLEVPSMRHPISAAAAQKANVASRMSGIDRLLNRIDPANTSAIQNSTVRRMTNGELLDNTRRSLLRDMKNSRKIDGTHRMNSSTDTSSSVPISNASKPDVDETESRNSEYQPILSR